MCEDYGLSGMTSPSIATLPSKLVRSAQFGGSKGGGAQRHEPFGGGR